MPHPLSSTTICNISDIFFHSTQIRFPASVWSKAFFTRLLTASIIHSRSQKSVISSSPERISSFCSCFARYAKCCSISCIMSDTFSAFFSIKIVPASNLVIFSRFCTNASMRSSSCSDKMANSFKSGRFSVSLCKIPL